MPITSHPRYLVSINTGLRQGELLALMWEDIDFARRVLTVRGALAKSGKYHAIGQARDRILIAEGYATAATLHEATGEAVAVAFRRRKPQARG